MNSIYATIIEFSFVFTILKRVLNRIFEESFEQNFELRVFAVKAFAGCALNKSRSVGMMGLQYCIIIKFIREARTRIMEIMTGNKGKVH